MSRRGIAPLLVLVPLAIAACEPDLPQAPSHRELAPRAADPDASLSLAPPFTVTAPLPLSPRARAALAADLAERTERARQSIEAPKRLAAVAGTFLVIAGDPGAPFDAAIALTERVVEALYTGPVSPLSHRPEKAVEVWVYSSDRAFRAGLHEHAVQSNEPKGLGFYDSQTRAIMVRTDAAGIFTLSHELAHPLIQADAPHAPVWLSEGISSLFELPRFTASGMHGDAHFRLQTLRDTLASSDEAAKGSVRLDAMLSWPDYPFYDRSDTPLRYAVAREAMRWLDGAGKLWPFYRACRDAALEDPRCSASFTRIVGKSPADATPDWLAWIGSKQAEAQAQ